MRCYNACLRRLHQHTQTDGNQITSSNRLLALLEAAVPGKNPGSAGNKGSWEVLKPYQLFNDRLEHFYGKDSNNSIMWLNEQPCDTSVLPEGQLPLTAKSFAVP